MIRRTVKNANAMQIILKRRVSGVITSIPPKRVVLCGNIKIAPIAIASPSAATTEQMPVAVDVWLRA